MSGAKEKRIRVDERGFYPTVERKTPFEFELTAVPETNLLVISPSGNPNRIQVGQNQRVSRLPSWMQSGK